MVGLKPVTAVWNSCLWTQANKLIVPIRKTSNQSWQENDYLPLGWKTNNMNRIYHSASQTKLNISWVMTRVWQDKGHIWNFKRTSHILAFQISLGLCYFDLCENIGEALSFQMHPWPRRMTSEIKDLKYCWLHPGHSLEPCEVIIMMNNHIETIQWQQSWQEGEIIRFVRCVMFPLTFLSFIFHVMSTFHEHLSSLQLLDHLQVRNHKQIVSMGLGPYFGRTNLHQIFPEDTKIVIFSDSVKRVHELCFMNFKFLI